LTSGARASSTFFEDVFPFGKKELGPIVFGLDFDLVGTIFGEAAGDSAFGAGFGKTSLKRAALISVDEVGGRFPVTFSKAVAQPLATAVTMILVGAGVASGSDKGETAKNNEENKLAEGKADEDEDEAAVDEESPFKEADDPGDSVCSEEILAPAEEVPFEEESRSCQMRSSEKNPVLTNRHFRSCKRPALKEEVPQPKEKNVFLAEVHLRLKNRFPQLDYWWQFMRAKRAKTFVSFLFPLWHNEPQEKTKLRKPKRFSFRLNAWINRIALFFGFGRHLFFWIKLA